MRKIFLYLALLFATTLMASEIDWAKDYKSAIKEAKRFNKPVFFVISRTTCPPCIRLENTTFKDKEVVKILNEDFVSVIAFTDKQDYMPRDLFLGVTPTLWFLAPDSQPMFQPIRGALDAKNLLEALSVVKDEFYKTKKSGK